MTYQAETTERGTVLINGTGAFRGFLLSPASAAAGTALAIAARAATSGRYSRRYCRLGLIVIKLDICRFRRRLAGQDKAFFEFPGLQRVVQRHVDLALGEQATAG